MRELDTLDRYQSLVAPAALAIKKGAPAVRICLEGVDDDVIAELDARLANARGWTHERRGGDVLLRRGAKADKAPL